MFANLLLAIAFQVGPFYEQKPDATALRPLWSQEANYEVEHDVLWPVYTQHADWWRFCFFTHYQSYPNDGYQFEVMPLWFNGRPEADEDGYWGLFPLYGYHPHVLTLWEWRFCLWPVWMQYRQPRPSGDEWLTSNVVLFPFIHWRSDGAWGFWPLYVKNYQRESTHQTALWPVVTWASYESDRDTAGRGYSWMVWPLWASVERERASQWMALPPLFTYARTPQGWTLACPWPLVGIDRLAQRERINVFPFYEQLEWKRFGDGAVDSSVKRFGWRLVELYNDETRVFPFWCGRSDGSYYRLWPFWEQVQSNPRDEKYGRVLSLFPIRWVPAVNRNWAKFWTFYEYAKSPVETRHSLFWGLIRWRTNDD